MPGDASISGSFALEEFVGSGALLERLDSLVADGWADVPTLKAMTKEDMDAAALTQQQRNALELRTYLHDRLLMRNADALEASGKTLSELLRMSPTQLTTEYKMRRGHVARFLNPGSSCVAVTTTGSIPDHLKHLAGETTTTITTPPYRIDAESSPLTPSFSPKPKSSNATHTFNSNSFNGNNDEFKAPVLLNGPFSGPTPAVVTKGTFSAPVVQPRLCGLLRTGPMNDEVTPLFELEKVMVQKLTPAYRKGFNPFKPGAMSSPLPPPTKASDMWAEQATLILILRRPGCVMCRAEAHQLYTRKPIFDAMGIQLVVCLNEHIEGEVRAFWPRYWGGMVVVDKHRDFFRALGQGKMPRENYLTGFFLNPTSRANLDRARATGMPWNVRGEGNIKGGLYIIRAGSGGVAYQFVERNFGDWAPLDEVLQACANVSQRR